MQIKLEGIVEWKAKCKFNEGKLKVVLNYNC